MPTQFLSWLRRADTSFRMTWAIGYPSVDNFSTEPMDDARAATLMPWSVACGRPARSEIPRP